MSIIKFIILIILAVIQAFLMIMLPLVKGILILFVLTALFGGFMIIAKIINKK